METGNMNNETITLSVCFLCLALNSALINELDIGTSITHFNKNIKLKPNKKKIQMCTNDRLANQMEGYMEDLVECFEEFVKKSMLVVSVAVGTLVLMVMYVLKLMSERTAGRQITDDSMAVAVNNTSQVSTQQLTWSPAKNPGKDMKTSMNDFLPVGNTRTISLQVIPNSYPSFGPSYAESFINEIDLGFNSKSFEACKQTQVSDDLKSARPDSKFMRTRQSCVTKNHLSTSRRCSKFIAMSLERNSCCSICCEDNQCNKWK